MPSTAFGLPVHALVVHAVVVLVPLAALGVIAIALRPAWRATYGWLTVLVAAVATVLVPVATSSGESLQERVGDSPAISDHAELGDQLLIFMVPTLAVAAAIVWLDRRRRAGSGQPRLLMVTSVLGVVLAIAVGVQVARIGHSGATAVWKPVIASTAGGGGG